MACQKVQTLRNWEVKQIDQGHTASNLFKMLFPLYHIVKFLASFDKALDSWILTLINYNTFR